jgi:hypothetical protein
MRRTTNLFLYALAAAGLYCALLHQPATPAGVAMLRRLRRASLGAATGAIAGPGGDATLRCAGRRLYATVPHHGLGNKFNWIGTALIAATFHNRCLSLATTDSEDFEDWGFAPTRLPSSAITFVSAVPAGIPRLKVFVEDDGGNDRGTAAADDLSTDVFGGDGYDCRRISTNCHALSEGVIRNAFFERAGDLDLGKAWFGLRPQQMPLPAFDASFTGFLQSLDLSPHLEAAADAIFARCRALSLSGVVIGAHYRAGDSCNAQYANATLRRCAPIVHLVTELGRALKAHPGAAVLLASDGPEVLASVQHAMPAVSICTSGRSEAAIDLRLLSRTHLIVGSRYSSFSHVAARWAGITLVEAG